MCEAYIHHMWSLHSPRVKLTFTICEAYIHHVWSLHSPYVKLTFTTCEAYIHHMWSFHSPRVKLTFTICEAYIHHMWSLRSPCMLVRGSLLRLWLLGRTVVADVASRTTRSWYMFTVLPTLWSIWYGSWWMIVTGHVQWLIGWLKWSLPRSAAVAAPIATDRSKLLESFAVALIPSSLLFHYRDWVRPMASWLTLMVTAEKRCCCCSYYHG